ncbi:hypothetical protein Tco_0337210, partial [Tanacetum coccineum]
MSTQQDIYDAWFRYIRPPMLKKDYLHSMVKSFFFNMQCAKSYGNLLVKSFLRTDDELTTEEAKRRKQSFSMSWEGFTSLEGSDLILLLSFREPEWKRYVTRVHQMKKLQEVDYNQFLDAITNSSDEVACHLDDVASNPDAVSTF